MFIMVRVMGALIIATSVSGAMAIDSIGTLNIMTPSFPALS
jgi:hypothetical protein